MIDQIPSGIVYVIVIILAYLIGSIPTGLFVVKLFTGEDIRDQGSGRTGGTNAGRAAGWQAGVLTGLGDVFKGIAAVNVSRLLLPNDPSLAFLEALCAVAVVVGHNYSVFIGFRGGAGGMANSGAAVALWPWSAAILLPVVPIVLIGIGYASLTTTAAAIVTVIIFTVRFALGVSPFAYVGYSIATLILVAIALLPNYKRLAEGTERRVGPRAKAAGQSSES